MLENQNKALIEELKSLKELYCQTKNDWDRLPTLDNVSIFSKDEADKLRNESEIRRQDGESLYNESHEPESEGRKEFEKELLSNGGKQESNVLVIHNNNNSHSGSGGCVKMSYSPSATSSPSLCSTSSGSAPSVITLHNARFLDVRKTLLLHKALVEDTKQQGSGVVVVCTTTAASKDIEDPPDEVHTPAATISCIRPTTSAVNDCEPD